MSSLRKYRHSLNLYEPLILDSTPDALQNITQIVEGWKRSVRLDGGCWIGSFKITAGAESGVSDNDLIDWFQTWLGCHLEERVSGMLTWAGMVYSLDLDYNGDVRRRSLDDLTNAVLVTYVSEANAQKTTTWATEARSIARYARKEDNLPLDGQPQTAAEAMRDSFLKEYAWPWARPVEMSERGGVSLSVKVCGYAFTAAWRFVTSADGNTGNLDAWITAILAADCADYLTAGRIATNTLQIVRTLKTPMRAWNKFEELVDLGDASSNPYHVWVDAAREVHYQAVSNDPAYYKRGNGLAEVNGEQVDPWFARPAVIRNMNYPVSSAVDPGTFLEDERDALITEIEAGETGLRLKTDLYVESDILAAWNDISRRMSEGGDDEFDKNKPWYDQPGWAGTDIYIPRLPRGARPAY